MPLTVQQPEKTDGLLRTVISGPVRGIDTKSGVLTGQSSTATISDLWENLQNMRLVNGQPVRMTGSTLYATSFVTQDTATPMAASPYIDSSGNLSWIVVQADGDVYEITVSGGSATSTKLYDGLNTTATFMSAVQLGDYLIHCDRTNGHWKFDGTNWLPLGAKIINNAEATTDWAVSGDALNVATSSTAKFGVNSITFDALLLDEEGTLTYDPTTLNVDSGLLLGDDYTEDDRLGFYFRCTDVSTLDTTATLFRVETSSGNDFDVPLSAWTDEAGTVITPADNTWHRVEHVISSGTEAGTYDHTSVDQIQFVWNTDGTGGCSIFVDQVYVRYRDSKTMPPSAVNSEFKSVYFAGDSTTAANGRSAIQYAKVGGPDEYNSLAFFQVKEKDGSNLSALHPFYNQLFIGKENSIHSLSVSLTGTTYPQYNFDLQQVTVQHGVSSHRSLVEESRRLWMYWRGEFWRYDGTQTQYMSNSIEPTLIDLADDRMDQVVGGRFNRINELWWSYPANGQTNNTVLIRYATEDPENGGWLNSAGQTIMGILPSFVSGEEVFLTVDEGGRFLQQNSGTTFDSTAIVCIARPPWMAMDDWSSVKVWLQTIVNFAQDSGGGTVTLQIRFADHPIEFDDASFATLDTFNNTSTSDESGGLAFIGERAKWIQLQLTTGGVTLSMFWPWIVEARSTMQPY